MSNAGLFDSVEECKNEEKEYYCNYCGASSSVKEIKRYARSKGFGHNTTCPNCRRCSAYYKMWLYPDGSRSIAGAGILIPLKAGFKGIMIPDRDSPFWPKNGDAILCLHPRECVPINGR